SVEDHEVGLHANFDLAAVLESHSMSGQRCHLADCFRQCDYVSVADVFSQDPREASGASRVCRLQSGVGAEHYSGSGYETLEIFFEHSGDNHRFPLATT